ncbi:MAG: putative oxidoreductase YqkF [Pirellulaceae bacterium]|nr:MAG: putative oxidoreductase YqkF [Pirellulaceae bacterium]
MEIPQRQLGRTGMTVTQLGYGTMGLRGPRTWGVRVVDEAAASRVLNAVLDAGINFLDTAPDYGIAEERIGRYLSHRRHEFLLATKCGCTPVQHEDHLEIRHQWTPAVIRANVEESLRRLRTDVIDLLQFHGGRWEDHQHSGALDAALRLREEGKIRHLGISTSLPEVEEHLSADVWETVQLPYSALQQEHDSVMRAASDSRLGVIVRGGVAHGGPDAEIQREALNRLWERMGLDELRPPDHTRAQFLLRFTLSHPACDTTIVGTCNLEHLQENIQAAARGPLSDELVAEIRRRWQKATEDRSHGT